MPLTEKVTFQSTLEMCNKVQILNLNLAVKKKESDQLWRDLLFLWADSEGSVGLSDSDSYSARMESRA